MNVITRALIAPRDREHMFAIIARTAFVHAVVSATL